MTEGTLEEGEDGVSIIVNWKVNLVQGRCDARIERERLWPRQIVSLDKFRSLDEQSEASRVED